MRRINFFDKSVSYEKFIHDIAASVVHMLSEVRNDPEIVSQRKAYKMFGRGNVERWRKEGKLEPCKRPGKVEYRTADLRALQKVQQDYFKK